MDKNESLKFWLSFFLEAGLPADTASDYAVSFKEHKIRSCMLPDLGREYLRELGVTPLGDVIAVLKHAKLVAQQLSAKSEPAGEEEIEKSQQRVRAANGRHDNNAQPTQLSTTNNNNNTNQQQQPKQRQVDVNTSAVSNSTVAVAGKQVERRVVRRDCDPPIHQSDDAAQPRDTDDAVRLASRPRRRRLATPPPSTADDDASSSSAPQIKQRRTVCVAKGESTATSPSSHDPVAVLKRTVFERLGGGERCQVSSTTRLADDGCVSSPANTVSAADPAPAASVERSGRVAAPRFTVTGLGDRHVAERKSLSDAVTTGATFLSNVLHRSLPRPVKPPSAAVSVAMDPRALPYQGVLRSDRHAAITVSSAQGIVCGGGGTLVSDRLAMSAGGGGVNGASVKQRISLPAAAAAPARTPAPATRTTQQRVPVKTTGTVKARLGAGRVDKNTTAADTATAVRSVFTRLGR